MKNLLLIITFILAFQTAGFALVRELGQIAEKCNEFVNTPIDLNITPEVLDVKLDLKNNVVKITVVESDMKAYAPTIVVASNTIKFDWVSQF